MDKAIPTFEGEVGLTKEAQLNILLVLMADARAALAEAEKKKANYEEIYPQYVAVLEDIKAFNKHIKEVYGVVASLAAEVYEAGGKTKKKLNNWVTVTEKEDTTFNYDKAKAVAWAIEKGLTQLLTVDKEEFEKVAEALSLDFVTINKTPIYGIRMAGDLSELETSKRLEE